jgi:hypothetical protein
MHDRRNLEWRLNWYRHSELDGALLLGRLVGLAREPYLVRQLTKHCADEARHSWLWQRTIVNLGLATVRIRRSYQSFYLDELGPLRSMTEALALTHIFERRVHRQFTEELAEPALPDELRRTLRVLLHDEEAHLNWIAGWLESHANATHLLRRYRDADERVYRRLIVYRHCSWEIDRLGDVHSVEKIDERHAEELHTAERQHSTQAPA